MNNAGLATNFEGNPCHFLSQDSIQYFLLFSPMFNGFFVCVATARLWLVRDFEGLNFRLST